MASGDRQVKITIGVDPASAEKAKAAIAEITKEVTRLVEATKGLGPLLGFGGGAARMTNTPGSPGVGAGTQLAHGGGGAKQGGLLNIVTAPAAAIGNVAAGAQKSVKTLKDGFKDLADAGEREARRLERSFGKFATLYTAANAQVASTRLAGLQAAGMADVERMGGGKKPPAPADGGMPRWLKDAAATYGGWRAVKGAEKMIVGGYFERQFAETQYNLAQPLFASSAQAQAGDIFGGTAVAIRHGDVGRAWAIWSLTDKNNKSKAARDYQHVISAQYKEDIKQQIRQNAPVTMKEMVAKNLAGGGTGIGGLLSSVADTVGAGATYIWNHPAKAAARMASIAALGRDVIPVGAGERVTTHAQMERAQEESRNVTRQAEVAQQLYQQYIRAHPQLNSDLNEFYGGSLGDTGLARAARLSGSFYRNPRTGAYGDTVSDYLARATEMGISGGERAAMSRRLAGTAGWGFFGHGDSLLGPEAGGLGNAAGIYGLGAQFGGGGWSSASGFMRGFQGQIGRGGLDVTAANRVSELIGSMMQGGGFGGGTGAGLRNALLEAASGGTPGWDMRGARMLAGGMGALGKTTTGTGSPLDQALNWSAALNIGGLNYGGAARFAHMNPETLLDIMRGGGVNPALAKLGINQASTQQYMRNRGASLFAGTINDAGFMGKDAQAAFQAFQRSGGNTHYMRGMSAKQRSEAESGLAAVAMARDTSLSPEQAQSEIRLLEGAWGDLPGLKGAGAGDSVSRNSVRAKALKVMGRLKREYGQRLESAQNSGGVITTALAAVGLTADDAERAGIDVSGAVESGGINGTIDQLDKILRKFVSQLHGEVGGGGAGPPGG
jgi:hypothetical protein